MRTRAEQSFLTKSLEHSDTEDKIWINAVPAEGEKKTGNLRQQSVRVKRLYLTDVNTALPSNTPKITDGRSVNNLTASIAGLCWVYFLMCRKF